MDHLTGVIEPENIEYYAFPSRDSSVFCPEQITALSVYSNLIYVGSSEGKLIQYVYEECDSDETTFTYTELLSRLISDSPVTHLETIPNLKFLVSLSNGNLLLWMVEHLEVVDFFASLLDVSSFCLHSCESDSCTLYVGTINKVIQIHHITNGTHEILFQCKLTSVPKLLTVGENFLCVAAEDHYYSLNLRTHDKLELLRFEKSVTKPFLAHVCQDEFLIAGPGALGIIVDAKGTSTKPPFQLSPNIVRVFIWNDYLLTVTEEFFTIHSIPRQTQLQTVPITNASAACFSPSDPHLTFISTSTQSSSDITAVGPERWDQFACRLVLADCLTQAKRILKVEEQSINTSTRERPVTGRHERALFTHRSRRLFSLVGLYYFEHGDFSRAADFFERGLIDLRELLYRYEDLLPSGYVFQPKRFHRSKQDASSTIDNQIRRVTELCLRHSTFKWDSEPNMSSSDQWAIRYDQFLFQFLQKHHRSRFTEVHLPLLETALVKLYVRLSKRGAHPCLTEFTFYAPDHGLDSVDSDIELANQHSPDLIQIISSLVHLDVEDLTAYLKLAQSCHVLALIYHWQGNFPAALDLWRRLAYNEITDDNFPGVGFYINILRSFASSNPISNGSSSAPRTSIDVPPIYVELVWKHFCQAVDNNFISIAEQILFCIPYSPSGFTASTVSRTTDELEYSLSPSQCFEPMHVLNKLGEKHADLGRRYLGHLIYDHADTNVQHHNMLANSYLSVIEKHKQGDNPSSAEYLQIRKEFCRFLRHSRLYSADVICVKLKDLGTSDLPHEYAIALGRMNKHRQALEHLLDHTEEATASALSYCLSYHHEISSINALHYADVNLSSDELLRQIFTILVQICLDRIDDENYFILAFDLMNSPDIPLNFPQILIRIPDQLLLSNFNLFLQRALRATVRTKNTFQILRGLVKHRASTSANDASSRNVPKVTVNNQPKCSRCHNPIVISNLSPSFAWCIQENLFAHEHCVSEA